MGFEEKGRLEKLNDLLLPAPKVIYFAVSCVFYTLYVFRPKFFGTHYLGLDDHEYGDVMAVMAIVSFAFMTLWSTFADAIGRHRLVLIVLCLSVAGSFELFLTAVAMQNHTLRFVLSAAVMGLYSFFACGILPLADFLTLKMLSNRPGFSRDLYGRQRLWGTIAFGIISLVVSQAIKALGVASLFYVLPIISISCALILLFLAPKDDPKPVSEVFSFCTRNKKDGANQSSAAPQEKPADPPVPFKQRPFIQLLRNPNYMFMLFVVFMIGSARAVMTIFLNKYLGERLHLNETQLAIAANTGILIEIIIFFFGPICLHTMGIYWMLIVSQFVMVVRCWAYVILPTTTNNVQYWVYAIELLKGVSFGFAQSAGVKLASDAAPRGLEATAQALYTSVYSQLPAVLTAIAGGRVYKNYGPTMLFYITAIVSSAALVLFAIKYFFDGSIGICGLQWRKRQAKAVDPPTVVTS